MKRTRKKNKQGALRLYLLQPEYIKRDLKAILINEVAVIFLFFVYVYFLSFGKI